MNMQRRTFLKSTLVAAGATVLAGGPALAAKPPRGTTGAQYPVNRSPLEANAFLRLPPGAVTPEGWLATQLDKQLTGLNGRYQDVSHFLDFSQTGWVDPSLVGWEEVPYWLRGYGDLGYLTGDSTVRSDTSKWIEAVLATQASDGFFGPTELRTSLNGHADFWPFMPMTHALRSWAEFNNDSRIDDLLTKFYQFMAAQPVGVFTDGWGNTRWGDTLDVLYWLYNRTGDSSLLTLATRIHQNSANWTNNIASLHNVNFAQGFRESTQYWTLSGVDADRQGSYQNYANMMATYGQFPGGGFAGDENARPGFGDPRQGFETCGIVEFMASHEILTRTTGDPVWADRTEQLAFNMLPAALDPQGKVTHYITAANSIQLDDVAKTLGQFDNGFAMQAFLPGVDQYRCCPHNYGQGWPYFIEEMWLATPDGGLAAALYAPSTVTALVSGGVSVTVTETTSYPFGDTVTFSFALPSPTAFPFVLRIPGWCTAPALTVNGAATSVPAGPAFGTIRRTWSNGDTVVLTLPRKPTTQTWAANHDSVSVGYGALTFSLKIDEQWNMVSGSADWPQWEVDPGSAWNYGLVSGQQFSVTESGGDLDDPFLPANSPITITAKAQRIPDWGADPQNVVGLLTGGPVASTAATEQVDLIPMGAARLRITAFPQTGGTTAWGTPGPVVRIENSNSGKVLAPNGSGVAQYTDDATADHRWQLLDCGDGLVKVRNTATGAVLGIGGASTADSAAAATATDDGSTDHRWTLVDDADGWFRLRNVNSGKVLGVDQMSTADGATVVQYDDNGTADHLWRLIPDGQVRIQNLNSTKVLGVDQMSTADSARVVQFADSGTADHLWEFVPDTDAWFRIRNVNSGKVLGVDQMSTADSAQVVQYDDNGTSDHLWRLLPSAGVLWRVQNQNSGKVLGVDQMSYADSANVVQFDDSGTPDHLWRLL